MTDRDFADMVAGLFEAKVGHQRVLDAEKAELMTDLWATTAELGLPWIGIDEEAGGSGGSLTDVVTLQEAAGHHAVPLPLLENYLAAWLVTSAGGEAAAEPWSVAPGTPRDTLTLNGAEVSGALHDVAWGGSVAKVVALVERDGATSVVLLDPSDAEVTQGRDIAGQPRDVLTFNGISLDDASIRPSAVTVDQLRQRGAVLRAAQMAGAMTAVFEITQRYTGERQQFGRPISKFQAVRSHIVQLAEVAVMTTVSAERAANALESGRDASFEAYAVKLLANQNAALSIKSGHQAHGAIGMTQEYALQDYTRRLNAWRGDWGTELALADRIGAAVVDAKRVATVAIDEGSLTV